jgi:transcriptional regulator with XRE-family HTH domain
MSSMPTYESAVARGTRMGRTERRRTGEQLRIARVVAGLSQRNLGAMVGLSHSTVGRMERGAVQRITVDRLALVAAVLGLDLRIGLFPTGTPVRDAAHLALLGRLRQRVPATLRWRAEVPVPIPGDLRSADVVIDGESVDAMVEAETRLGDLQAMERRTYLKQRDIGSRRVILLVADTRHNRAVLEAHPELVERFPVSTRACLQALRDGRDPGGNAIVLL